MTHIEFPKWKYHAELPALIVASKDAEMGLGEGWLDLPYVAAPEVAAEVAPEAEKSKPAKRGPKPKGAKGEE
jgi:hypothetical protein